MPEPFFNEKKDTFNNIINVIQETLDVNKTKNIIIETICKTFNANRCCIVDYDKRLNKFLPIEHEYISSDKVSSCRGQDVQTIVPGLVEAAKKGKFILVKNKEIFFDTDKQVLQTEQDTFEKYDINSLLVLPLFYQNELLGILSAHYTNGHEITDSEINIIKNIGNQAVLAIHRANLYEMNQAQLKKAEATKKIIEASRKSLELEVLLSDICKELAELFKFQRATIGQLIRETPEESVAVGEYIYNKNIKSYKSHSGFGEIIKYWSSYLMREKKTKIVNDISNSDMPAKVAQIYKEIGINSIACIPLRSEENMIWGGMFLSEKEDNRNVIEENLEFLETVGSQIYIAIRQAELYKKEKEALERESLLRKITSAIRSTLDIDELEKIIVEKIAKALRADRCFIIAYDDETNKFLPVKT